ncbi:STAS domain-containing protein [Mesoterricola silvestris]|uniref:Anti-sigma factor antagonist n=1 Tax=Mesoterricola silvestris TaxID=2927979 RepID=A0AA48KCP3_9BACT|nr:STAS domain-containing protein [Mesoterricola silvestris]BDU73718.1 putative anti-sigma factor antagonist [Mesoterricola silvestris]
MKITLHEESDIQVIRAEGKIAAGSGEQLLSEAVQAALDRGRLRIVIDFSRVTTMDSSGLGELVAGFTGVCKARGQLCLSGLNSRIYRLLRMTNLHSVMTVQDTEAEAVIRLREGEAAGPR